MRDEGGAVARVTSITHHDVTPQTPTLITQGGTTRWSSKVRCNGRCVAGSRTGGTPTSELIDGRPCFSCKKLPTDGALLRACSKNEFPRIWRFPMSSEPVILLEQVLVERGNFCLEIPKLQWTPGTGRDRRTKWPRKEHPAHGAGRTDHTHPRSCLGQRVDPALQPLPGGLNSWLGWG